MELRNKMLQVLKGNGQWKVSPGDTRTEEQLDEALLGKKATACTEIAMETQREAVKYALQVAADNVQIKTKTVYQGSLGNADGLLYADEQFIDTESILSLEEQIFKDLGI